MLPDPFAVLPPGRIACPACGAIAQMWTEAETLAGGGARHPRGLSFQINACPRCGHVIAIENNPLRARSLTRREAAELAAHPDFQYVRGVVAGLVAHLWG